ncbi:hypothetical protein CKM354_000768000 [Cercospora kikuchii]|uniref:Uncharacterized protein n=1 Tax=Cercospora kikuchii TaxID=84275 RepID=A0A9P3CKL3_9PEZI|nr:uncharacterized protein CKM354_000768000 [Cercospora kikuchii]GIZ44483.1 hypothetical protein CKM354_000768000 [Cercospora kikuchii]
MGQRHQLFAVAKVSGRYRVLAAVHHQCLFEEEVVECCLQTLYLLQHNASLLRQDLQVANETNWDSIKPPPRLFASGEPTVQRVREVREVELALSTQFPMIATCLMTGAARHRGGFYPVRLFPITHSLKVFDNDDGYSIFDVTDPEHPRYCNLLKKDSYVLRKGETEHVQSMAPLEARQYLACYRAYLGNAGGDDDWSSRVAKAYAQLETDSVICDLQGFSLIDADALAETWPYETFKTPSADVAELSEGHEPAHEDARIESLREKAFSRLFSQAVEDEDGGLSWLADAEKLSDFTESALDYFRLVPGALDCKGGPKLLGRILQGRRNVDLSGFVRLTSEQLLQIVTELQNSSNKIRLTLPCLNSTPEDVSQLAHAPKIVNICFGTTEGLELKSLIEAASGARLEYIAHPEMYKTALTAVNENYEHLPQITNVSIGKMLRGPSLCQAVWIAANTLRRRENESESSTEYGIFRQESSGAQPDRLASGSVAWAGYFASTSESCGKRGHFAAIGQSYLPEQHNIVPLPLHDMPMPPQELIPRLYTTFAVEVLPARVTTRYDNLSFKIAMSLSLQEDWRVTPLPAALLDSYAAKWSRANDETPLVKPIVAGEWTMLVCQERNTDGYDVEASTVHHCFVSRDQEGNLICRTLKEFLELVPPIYKHQKDRLDAAKLTSRLRHSTICELAVGDCDIEEAEEAIKATEMYNDCIETWYRDRQREQSAAPRTETASAADG